MLPNDGAESRARTIFFYALFFAARRSKRTLRRNSRPDLRAITAWKDSFVSSLSHKPLVANRLCEEYEALLIESWRREQYFR